MKKIYVFLAIITFSALSINTSAQAPNTWTQKANVGGPDRCNAVGFNIGANGYIGTGVGSVGNYDDFWEYDTTTNTWTQKANVGGPERYIAVGFNIGAKGYIGTGNNLAVAFTDFWEYDTTANTWTQKANFGGGVRYYAVGFSIGSKGYIGTGMDGTGNIYNDFWEYDPATNIWTQKANFGGTPRYGAVGFSIGTKGYIGTGIDANFNYYNDFWEYDPSSNTWTLKANFGGAARARAVGFSIGGKGYIGTGASNYLYTLYNDFWEYDTTANTWTQKANFGGAVRCCAVGFSIGSKGFIGTGYSQSSTAYKDFWEYSPSCILPNAPTNTTPPANQNICSGNSTTLSASGTDTLGWYSAATGGIWLGGGNTFTTPILTSDTAYYVQDSTCGPSLSRTRIPVTVNPLPVPALSGPVTPCVLSSGNVYSTEPGMIFYIWIVSSGGAITSGWGTNSIAVTWDFAGPQNVSVNYTDANGCTAINPSVLSVNVEPLPVPTITGPDTACILSTGNNYITESGMLYYIWTVSSGGVITSGWGTNSIAVTWDSAGPQQVTVLYTNQFGCTAVNPTSFNVTVEPLPGIPGNITGPSPVCAGSAGLVYTVSPVSSAISYVWTLPSGFLIVSGNGTDSITVTADTNASSENILVYGTNNCGNGPSSPPFAVIVNYPATGNAGPDGLTCQTTPFTVTQASASNYSSVHWHSNGHGILTGTMTLSPTYTPAQGETGPVTLTLIIYGKAPCDNDTSRMILTIEPKAIVNAGNDLTTCGEAPVILSGSSASDYQSLLWTTSGSGVFNDPMILHPTYTPGISDVNAGSVFLTLHATSAEPCDPDSSRVLLTIARPVYVYAGHDSSLCGDQPFQLSKAIAIGYSTITWSTTGDGTFDDPNIVNPVYTPGNSDILQGKVTLTITAAGVYPCSSQTDSLTLIINKKPTVHPGPDGVICQGMTFTVEGVTASDFSHFTWQSNGQGILSETTTLSPVYTPGTDETGTVVITLKVFGTLSCQDSMVSCQVKVNIYSPVAVKAGEDQTIDYDSTTIVHAKASGGTGDFRYEWEPSSLLVDDTALETQTLPLKKDTVFIITVTDKETGCISSDSTKIIVEGPGEGLDSCIVIHNVITPNGDGKNDTWIIDCIEDYPDNTVQIFNRWGDVVNSFDRYDNTTQVWKGTNKSGKLLPAGTYYYVLQIRNEKARTGWILLR
jgi:gliding motility-associated-like protein